MSTRTIPKLLPFREEICTASLNVYDATNLSAPRTDLNPLNPLNRNSLAASEILTLVGNIWTRTN
jgi:hypothetical protein